MNWAVLKGRDLWAALAVCSATWLLMPAQIENNSAKEIYSVEIPVLSIVFSVFFAALAVIIATGDDGFVRYLRERRFYDKLLGAYRFTVALLFFSLLLSVLLFVGTVVKNDAGSGTQPALLMIIFSFFFSYSLGATLASTNDSFQYARLRVKYLAYEKREQKGDSRQQSVPPDSMASE